MRPILILSLLTLAACSTAHDSRPTSRAEFPGVLASEDFPEEVTQLLTAAEADSCGVCIREKRADAFALADEWFAPGTRVQSTAQTGWHVLPGGDHELYFGAPDERLPTLSFRFHTESEHLIGIQPDQYTDEDLARRILARPPGESGTETLEVIPFAYGDGASFLFDEEQNRLQIQCQVLTEDPITPAEAP
jgi:hypothetical protein